MTLNETAILVFVCGIALTMICAMYFALRESD